MGSVFEKRKGGNLTTKFVKKVIFAEGFIIAKRYDYISRDDGEVYSIWRRTIEGYPWNKIYEIPKKSIDDRKTWKLFSKR